MRILIQGKIIDFAPLFKAYVRKEGPILSEEGDLLLTVDTGFSGAVALPQKMLREVKVEPIGYGRFTLATGEVIQLPIFWGKAIIKNREIETWFIPGDFLIGIEFLSSAGKLLTLDFEEATVNLMERKSCE